MNLAELKQTDYQLLEIIAGSHMYGLSTATSDIDIRGIYNLPIRKFLNPAHRQQINDNTNDEVHYELAKFLRLAQTANPTVLELLFAPTSSIKFDSPKMTQLYRVRDSFLTKQCKNSLGGYAVAQIKKARGHNKKVVSPIVTRKEPIDFCYFMKRDHSTMPLRHLLELCESDFNDIGLSKINNFHDSYVVHSKKLAVSRVYVEKHRDAVNDWVPSGIMAKDRSDIKLSSIPKEISTYGILGIMHFNRDGYSSHCKDYISYTDWEANRNPERYASTMKHGKGYDAKNMMHCFRLLHMGIEVAETGILNVVRPDRKFLLNIRAGEFEFDELVGLAETKLQLMNEAFEKTDLPDQVSSDMVEDLIADFKL